MAMFQGFGLLLPWIVLPYVLAAIMPTWRWLLGCALLIGGGCGYLWIEHILATHRPGYHEGAGDVLGLALFFVATTSFACGVGVRAVSLFVWWRGRRKRAFWVCVFGIAVPFAVMAAPEALRAWQQRPAPARCTERGIPIEIGQQRLNIPVAPLFSVHRGASVVRDSYYMFSPAHVRDLCARTEDGARRVHATNLAIRFDPIWQWKSNVCGQPSPSAPVGFSPHDPLPWAAKVCAAIAPAAVLHMDPTDFPLSAFVYSLPEVKLGEFMGSSTGSTYRDSQDPPRVGRDDTYTITDIVTAGGDPLTFACRLQSDGTHWCTTSYPWSNGTHLHYAFRTREDIAAKGKRVDETTRAFLSQFQAAGR
jgi:hypothetical protein